MCVSDETVISDSFYGTGGSEATYRKNVIRVFENPLFCAQEVFALIILFLISFDPMIFLIIGYIFLQVSRLSSIEIK